MRIARPVDALSTVSAAHWYESAAFGEKCASLRPGQTLRAAALAPICVKPADADHHSMRPPSTVFHRGANAHASCAYRLCNRVCPPTSLATVPGESLVQL